ncbi:hypothetical protein Acr_09g0006950 [Actinidia rufa]|uniref:Uncharacterized protein n=1 Tax=Actinidia rufa TaxID=165716 RepID=A0A7J0F7P9_9ERIC|nr:hypothetical protein Acr_09g0006950 [Actinidia rufa]
MDSKEGESAGVTWVGAEAPSNYHVAVRTENPTHAVALGSPIAISPPTAVAIGLAATMERKRRGRPRKYGPSVGIAVPTVISPPTGVAVEGLQQWRGKEEADPESMDRVGPLQGPCRQPRHQPHHRPGAESSVAKQGGGQPIGSESNQWYNVVLRYAGDYCDLVPCSAEACLIPHLINIEKGEKWNLVPFDPIFWQYSVLYPQVELQNLFRFEHEAVFGFIIACEDTEAQLTLANNNHGSLPKRASEGDVFGLLLLLIYLRSPMRTPEGCKLRML